MWGPDIVKGSNGCVWGLLFAAVRESIGCTERTLTVAMYTVQAGGAGNSILKV